MTTESETTLIKYLREQIANGKMYFKSKYIAEEIGITPKQVGATLFRLSERRIRGIKVMQWSSSNSTTWQVTRG
jgi:hypothetical protein